MIEKAELRKIAKARLKDAEALLSAGRHDGAVYLCGYAVEVGLKARICKMLRWEGYPLTASEFKDYQSFKAHDLEVLLRLSGVEKRIKTNFLTEWPECTQWHPEMRYEPTGKITKQGAEKMIKSAETILRIL